jgi:hypothetical protein
MRAGFRRESERFRRAWPASSRLDLLQSCENEFGLRPNGNKPRMPNDTDLAAVTAHGRKLEPFHAPCPQTAFGGRNVRLGVAQRGARCVDRVGAEDEIVLVRDGRTENEFSVGLRLELDRLARTDRRPPSRRAATRREPTQCRMRWRSTGRCDPSGARNASARQPSGGLRDN